MEMQIWSYYLPLLQSPKTFQQFTTDYRMKSTHFSMHYNFLLQSLSCLMAIFPLYFSHIPSRVNSSLNLWMCPYSPYHLYVELGTFFFLSFCHMLFLLLFIYSFWMIGLYAGLPSYTDSSLSFASMVPSIWIVLLIPTYKRSVCVRSYVCIYVFML